MSKGKVIPVDIFDDKCVIQEENEANHILTTSKYFLISTVDGILMIYHSIISYYIEIYILIYFK